MTQQHNPDCCESHLSKLDCGRKQNIGQNITNVGFHGKPLIFFYFVTNIHGLFFEFLVVFTKIMTENFETLVLFMKCNNKKIEPPLPLGGFILFYFRISLNTQSYKISANIFVKPAKIQKIIHETRSQKKMGSILLKPHFWGGTS